MTIRKLEFSGSLALSVFLGCSTGGALVVDHAAPRAAVAQDVDEGYFYANLAPHGQWFFQADFGWVWHPARVSAGWRPYTEGQWVWANDVGWTWASQEPWGWATYHYGRWYFDPNFGWSWVPGRTWAPAWVSWRIESGFIGWAPLWPVYFDRHPEYRWDRWSHDHDWDRRHNGRDWDRWVFTRDRDFTSDRVGRYAVTDRRERDRIFRGSRDVTQFDERRPERIGHSIDRAIVEKATGRPVRAVRIDGADKPEAAVDTKSDRIRMFRPQVRQAADKTPDRLGLAKEPSREARETDTIRKEKLRLDNIPEQDKARARAAHEPVAREKDNERGGRGSAGDEPAAAVVAPVDRDNARPDRPVKSVDPSKKESPDRGADAKTDKAAPTGERKNSGQPRKEDRAAPAERVKPSREPAASAEPAEKVKPERAPSGQMSPDRAAPAATNPGENKRERMQSGHAEREPAAPPQQAQPPKHAQPQREPARQEQPQRAQQPQQRERVQQEQPGREPAAQDPPQQQKHDQPNGKKNDQPNGKKKQPQADEPHAAEPAQERK